MSSTEFILTRRRLLTQAAAVPLAGLASAGSAATAPHLDFPTRARDRLAVTSYPFRAYIESPTNSGRDASKSPMDLKEFPAMIARRFDIYNINPLLDHFHSTDAAYLDAFRTAVQAAKSHIVDLGLGGKKFYDPDRSVRDEAVAYGCKGIDVAQHVGSPSVRQHIHASAGAKPSVKFAAESLRRLADYGEKHNVVVNLENDAAVSEDPFFLVAVINRVNSPYLRALPDFGNTLSHHNEMYNERGLNAMFAHAFNMAHVKNIITRKGGEVYKVNVPKGFSIAAAHQYRGYFSMEFDTGSGDPFEGTDALITQSLDCLAAANNTPS
jgi:sugar phosphate isomerase/epimerase